MQRTWLIFGNNERMISHFGVTLVNIANYPEHNIKNTGIVLMNNAFTFIPLINEEVPVMVAMVDDLAYKYFIDTLASNPYLANYFGERKEKVKLSLHEKLIKHVSSFVNNRFHVTPFLHSDNNNTGIHVVREFESLAIKAVVYGVSVHELVKNDLWCKFKDNNDVNMSHEWDNFIKGRKFESVTFYP